MNSTLTTLQRLLASDRSSQQTPPSTRDEEGTELKVMLRPASALQVVGARMAEEFARLGLAPSA